MKITSEVKKKEFIPITITLESKEEALSMLARFTMNRRVSK